MSDPTQTDNAGIAVPSVPVRTLRLPVALIAAIYLAAALAGNLLALPPGYASPLWPASGLALGALLLGGARCWPGVWVGAFLFHLWLESSWPGAAVAAILALGATLQALLGARLTRCLFDVPVPLAHSGDVARFLLLSGPTACLAGASVGVAALAGFGRLEPPNALSQWLVWWTGDTLGVLLFAPLALLVWPRAGAIWGRTGGRIALPLLVTAALLAAGNVALQRMEETAAARELDQRMDNAADAGLLALQPLIESLRGIERFKAASEAVTAPEYRTYSALARRWPGTLAVAWVEWVPQAQRTAFEVETRQPIIEFRADGVPAYAAERADYFPVRFTEPLESTRAVLGVDFSTLPGRRAALERARDTAAVAATGPLSLRPIQRPGVLVFVPDYQPGFQPETATVQARREALRGFVVGAYDSELLFSPLGEAARARHLSFRVTDVTPGEPARLLAATFTDGPAPKWARELSFGGRTWRIEMRPAQAVWSPGGSLQARFYYLLSMLAGFLVAFAAVGAAGRGAAVAAEVTERTADLERELAARRVAEIALRGSERNLDTTLHSIGDGVLATDARGRVTRLNAVAERLTGWSWLEAQGRPIEEVFRIVNEQTRRPVSSPVEAVLSTGAIQGLANHTVLIARDGSESAIADSAAPIRDAEGVLHGVVLVFRNVSEERTAERALQASEARYRQLIELSPYGIFVYSEGLAVYANPKAVSMLGAESSEQLLGRPVLEFLHPDGRDVIAGRMRRVSLERLAVPAIEQKWLRLDGSGFVGESIAVPYQHEGEAGGLVLVQDITERKEAEARLAGFFELSPDIFCVVGTDGYFHQVNPAFIQTMGWTRQELLERPLLEFAHPEEEAAVVLALERLTRGEPVARLESRWLCKDGSWRWLSWRTALRPDGTLVATARDVSRARADKQQLEQAKADAEIALRAKSAFLATMSHEIRTPMNGVLGMVEVLAYSELTAHQSDLVRTIRESASTLLSIIDDILDFSKIEAGRLQLERAPVWLSELVEGLCNSMVPIASAKNVDLDLFVAPALAEPVLSDEVRLRQVLYNLVGNAIKFSAGDTARRGRVSIRVEIARASPLGVRFRIEDNGIGMAAETLDGLFTAFTQAEVSTTRRFGGSGLGLTICKRLVDQMGGEIEVKSALGAGTTFTVTLPFEIAPGQPPRSLADLSGIDCILVRSPDLTVDDLQAYLEPAGARVQLAADAAAAARAAERLTTPAVIVHGVGRQRAPALAPLAMPNVRHLLITRGRRRQLGAKAADAVLLDGSALRRQSLLRAVAVAAGRASPELIQEDGVGLASPERAPPSVDEARAQGRLVLVAEDDKVNQKVIRQQLTLLGYAAEIADNGAEALRRLSEDRYGLLLTDLHMPEMDGYALAEAIRRGEKGARRLPILALTANALRGEANRAMAAGMDEYLTKPIQLQVLKAALDRWLPLRDGEPGAAPPRAGRSKRSGGAVDLTVLTGLVGDDPGSVRELLSDYLVSVRRLAEELKAAVAAGDAGEVGAIAHKLKSSSRSVGALALGELCAGLEGAAKAGDAASVAESVPQFELTVVAATTEIAAYLSQK